jgi:hypothetical protein
MPDSTANLEISSAIKTIRDACDRYDHKGTPQHDPNREPLPERIVIDTLEEALSHLQYIRTNREWGKSVRYPELDEFLERINAK